MRIAGVLMSVLLVFGCIGTASGFSQEAQGDITVLSAEIVSVDPEGKILVVEGYEEAESPEGKEITLNLSDETVILLENEEIGLYDLMAGDSVTIEHYADASGKIIVTKVHLEYGDIDIEEEEVSVSE